MKTGRPKLLAQDRKGQITGVRLRQYERQKVEMAAQKRSQKLSDWIRDVLVATADHQLQSKG